MDQNFDKKAFEWLDKNELNYIIWNNKYRHNNESFDEWINRISGSDKEIKNLILNKKFLFGGRILANRGIDYSNKRITLSNCYVITPPEDNLESIFDTGSKLARVYSTGGGCIEENTKIIVKNKGRVPICNVQVGDYVLSFNIKTHKDEWKKVLDKHYTEVDLNDQIEYVYNNGVRLKTSTKHPILNLTKDGYEYKKYPELEKENMHINKAVNKCRLSKISDPEVIDTSWILGFKLSNFDYFHKHPEYIKDNNSYLAYLAGALERAGYVTDENDICIELFSEQAVKDITEYLSEKGQNYKVKNRGVTPSYELHIYPSTYLAIRDYLTSDNMISKFDKCLSDFDNTKELIFITDDELKSINDPSYSNLIKAEDLYNLYKNKVFNKDQYEEILSRVYCKEVIQDDKVKYKYIDITVEDNENYYAGEFGFVNIHNCGIDVSNLRPKNSKVNNSALTTSGATSFMDFFSYITGLICQEGRRGALMISIDCTHPDLEDFINLKSNLDICTKANISVRISDEFMKAVEEDKDWELSFTSIHETIKKTVKAKEIFNLLAKRNWEMAEPGILFWDNIKNNNMLNNDPEFSYAGVNPCAEEPLPAGGSCLLGSINLSEFVKNPFTKDAYFDVTDFYKAVYGAVNALNDVLMEGLNLHPLEEQRSSVNKWRQIGLGTMGLGDALIKLNIKYGSEESIAFINLIYKQLAINAVLASLEKAKTCGAYPGCKKDLIVNSNFIKNLCLPNNVIEQIKKYGLYNSQLLTCAPTGTTSTMISTSGGIEPNFAFSFNRRTISLNNEETVYKIDAKIVKDYKEITGNKTLPDYFIASHEIPYRARIDVQAAVQKYIDASISSTVNLPESTTVEEVADLYHYAWQNGLKGITIWRDNCQRQGILTTGDNKSKQEHNELTRGFVVKADDNCIGLKRTLTTGCGTLHCTAYFDPVSGELRETYLSKGSTGGCNNSLIGLSRMISLAARGGLSVDAIIDQLNSCGVCPSYAVRKAINKDVSKGSCCPVAVGHALRSMYNEMQTKLNKEKLQDDQNNNNEECPNCHNKTLIHHGGCVECKDCGYSKCE